MITSLERALMWVVLVLSALSLVWLIFFVSELTSSLAQIHRSSEIAMELRERLAALQNEHSVAVMLFVGDIMLSRSVGSRMEAVGDYKYSFLEVGDVLRSADLTFGNLEGPISDRGHNQGSIYSFRADPRVIEGLVFAGMDVLSLANNHIWDWGRDALLDTISILEGVNVVPVGVGANYEQANEPALFNVGDAKIAVLAYTNLLPESLEADTETPGLSDFDLGKVEMIVNDLSEEGYLVVVSIHWGDEYEMLSNDSQKNIGRSLIDAGADLIVGHHPHVVQELEQYGNGWIAYSLGNFIFDQTFSAETMRGAALRVELDGEKINNVSLLPVNISSDFQASFEESNIPQQG